MDEFITTWNLLLRWQLPTDQKDGDESRVLMFMPIIGLIIGLTCYMLAGIIQLLVGKPLLAGFLGGTAIFSFFAYGVKGQRLRALAEAGTMVELKREEQGQPPLPGGVRIAQIFCIGWLLAVMVAIIGLIADTATLWLLVPATFSAAALAEMTNRHREKPTAGHPHWLVAGLIGLLLGIMLGRITLTMLALLLAWVAGSGNLRISIRENEPARQWLMISLLEVSLLWIGALAL